MSLDYCDQKAITETMKCKRLISVFLAEHRKSLNINKHVVIDFYNELTICCDVCMSDQEKTPCEHDGKFASPIRCICGDRGYKEE